MRQRRKSFQGQVSLEFGVLLICIVAALFAMQCYIKRSVQGRLRQSADELAGQYDPNTTTSTMSVLFSSDVTTEVAPGNEELGKDTTVTTVTIDSEVETRSGEDLLGTFAESGGLF